ncbi:MAG: ABC transporter ATP-binding protein [Deltaproteobacteria bacterium]|nr:ABC transporter ATP-binding protein [Deltaproteobacteria bacterium]
MAAPVLVLEQVVKQYPGLRALDGVSLAIAPGEIFALLGPNGAGKTTLIGAACGLVRKTSGRVSVLGVDLDVDPVRPRYDVGLVPQEINFDPFFTARETLEIQLGYFGRSKDAARVDELLAALSLSAKADVPTRALSGGMKRRLLIAKALVHRPRLVFLDEPTAGVDVELRRDLWGYVRRLRAQGTTVVLTTHYLEEAEELADRVGIIDHGRLLVVEEKGALMQRLGERHLEVKFREPVAALPAGPATAGTLSADGRGFSFHERRGTAQAAEVLAGLFAAGLPVGDVTMAPASLEDVLLRVLASEREAQAAGGAR